ncbi:MAG: hypothetical protein KF745_09395 [Phycisphaeraceae bacterium]|nr:hypothetical protein [Phycisphaeraceae bacterium]
MFVAHRHRDRPAPMPRVEITLRGLRVTLHRKNPTGLAGTVVPWHRVRLRESAIFYDDRGRLMRRRWLPIAIPLTRRERAAAYRARFRAVQRGLDARSLELVDVFMPRMSRWIAAFVLAAIVGEVVYLAGWKAPALFGADAVQLAVAGLGVAAAALPIAIVLEMLVRETASRVTCIRTDGQGIEVESTTGAPVFQQWSDLVRVRHRPSVYLLDFADGSRLCVPNTGIRTRAAILHEWRRVEPLRFAPKRRWHGTNLSWADLLWLQAVGVAAAAAWWGVGDPASIGKGLATYALVAIGLPFLLPRLMAVLLAPEHLSRRRSCRRDRHCDACA